jgi:GH24 family phage-related lysozyme (muramidase)
MKITWNGFCFTLQREACVLVPYPDGEGGGYSQGFGHYGVSPDAPTITLDQGFRWAIQDVEERERQLDTLLKVPVLPCMYDAVFSLLFNWGSGNLRKSDLLAELNQGHYGRAADLITTVKNSTPGLMKRRLSEREIFLNGDYGDVSQFRLYRTRPIKGENTPFEWTDFPPEGEGS